MSNPLDIPAVFSVINGSLPEFGPALVAACSSVYGFDLTTDSGPNLQYTLDLSHGQGSVEKGLRSRVNAIYKASIHDMLDFFQGKVTLGDLFTTGKLRVSGSVGRATRLNLAKLPQFSQANVNKYRFARL